ncbi:MAG: ABC transporter permease [Verrucomicrobia bacterium]|nr:ABC transporter permease [Verrucomicrobiota bacterium]
MNNVFALSGVVIKELYRRKDFYVLFVLTALITLVLGSVNFFNDPKIVRYLKDICLLLIWVSSLVIAITTAARQIPAERENRTIFPLLAKPVTRGQVIVGKFMGCWLACGFALLVFYVFFTVVSGTREHDWHLEATLKMVWLHWVMLGVVVAMVLLGSIVFSAPSANITICFIAVIGILGLGRYLHRVALQQSEPMNTILSAIYFAIPHLEWYDVRDFLVNEQQLASWFDCGLATIYGAAYMGFFMCAAWVMFRRKTLTV